MKSQKILLLLMLISLLLCVASACSKGVSEEEIPINSYDTLEEDEIVVENDNLALHFDPVTTHFSVVKKSTGDTWYSNPVDADSDVLAQGINKKDLNATVSLYYNTESGSPTFMNNFGSSIEKGNFTYEVLEDGIKVKYTIGDLEKVYIMPTAVPESRWNEFYTKMDPATQAKVIMNYKKYDINKLGKKDNKEELTALYPDIVNEPIYVMREATQDYMKLNTETFFSAVGYTQADYELDLARYSVTSTSDKPIFNVTIIYKLEGNDLVVTMPLNEIQYKHEFPITEIRPLAYFGAGGTSATGFMVVPDGSGGIINFNNHKVSQNTYTSNVFGWDYAIKRDAVIDETRVNMPLFGISNKNSSFICVLEDGSSYGYIEAEISGKMCSYNFANANYTLVHNELMDISAKSDTTVRMFQEKLPDENITQRYIFIDKNDYPSMATTYREYLMANHPELKKVTTSDLPVAVELIGAVDRTKHFLGIPTKKPDALTTYKDAVNITDKLLSMGISDLSIKYNGWFNDGIMHDAPNKVKLISELGSKRDFNKMVTFMNDNNVKLYLESTFQFVYNNSMFDNFMSIRDAAKFVNRKVDSLYPYHPVIYGEYTQMPMYYLAKPAYYLKNIDGYAKGIEKLGVKNIAFGDIGRDLSADYDDKDEVSREAARKLQVEKLKELSTDGYGMMFESGNIYAVPYADFIVDINLATKGYNIIDEEIPFYEIALHGLVPYAGKAVNLAEDYERNLLKTVETGAGLYFIFMQDSSFELQDSNYTKYFSSEFGEWSDITSELYTRMKKDFGHLYNQYIVDHQVLDKGVTMTVYEDGTKVIVNYNESAYSHNGTEIPAKDYIVEGGKQ